MSANQTCPQDAPIAPQQTGDEEAMFSDVCEESAALRVTQQAALPLLPTPAAFAILRAMLADAYIAHAALIDAVSRCRWLPGSAGVVYVNTEDWAAVWALVQSEPL